MSHERNIKRGISTHTKNKTTFNIVSGGKTLQERNGHIKAKMTCSYSVPSADIQAQVYWEDKLFKSRKGMETQPETTVIEKTKRSYLNFTPG